jgi:hypothetical protein
MIANFSKNGRYVLLSLLFSTAMPLLAETQPALENKTASATNDTTEIPQSVFVIPSSPKEGRNPFFPKSVIEAPVQKIKPEQLDSSSIILNGITSPPKQTAMINGKTFEPGESGEVRFPNGSRISIQCIEIRTDAAIILIGTQKRELRLRAGL